MNLYCLLLLIWRAKCPPYCLHTERENNRSWKKVNGAFRGCGVLSSTWTGPKHRSVGYHGQCHEQPALAGLSQTEGVTQKTAVRLTSVGSDQTQPAACQHSPTRALSHCLPSPVELWCNNAGMILVDWREETFVGHSVLFLRVLLLCFKDNLKKCLILLLAACVCIIHWFWAKSTKNKGVISVWCTRELTTLNYFKNVFHC